MPGTELSYYDLLGLKPDASQDEIRAAYDSLMARIRPNVEFDTASTIRVAAAVKEAWETLGDPGKRHAYDETLRGTAAYADIWRRSQQASYLEKRNEWFDQQVRRAQSERQAEFEHQAERKQFDEDSETVAASIAAVDVARDAATRAAAERRALARGRLSRTLAVVAAIVACAVVIAAGMWARDLFARRTTALPLVRPTAAAPSVGAAPSAGPAASRPRSPNAPRQTTPSHSRTATQAPAHASTATLSNPSNPSPVSKPSPARASPPARSMPTSRRSPQRRTAIRPSYVCRTVAIATVTHDGSMVDLSDGRRYTLSDPVDKAQAGGWTTGTAVAECAWPAALKRPASLVVNGYSVRAVPAVIAAVAAAASSGPTSSSSTTAAPACADASITQVTDDGYGIALSDGHVYAVDIAGHVTTAAWLIGDAVSVCSSPSRGANSFTVARYGVVVNAARTQSLSTAAAAPTLCVVRLISALAADGARVVLSDGHTYRVDGTQSRAIVASWALGERVTVCVKLTSGTVNATLARAGLTAHAIRAD